MSVSRRHFFLGTLALSALSKPVWAAKKHMGERPNLLLILADGLSTWHLGVSGNQEIRTPAIDRLSGTGSRFFNHFSCSPAPGLGRTVLMTGKTPMQLGEKEDAAVNSLDKMIAGLGYACGTADAGAAARFLDQQSSGKPFFLTVNCPGLRAPYEGVPQKDRDLYAKVRFDTLNSQRSAASNAQGGKEMFGDVVGSLRKAAAAITAFDDEVGGIIARLTQRGLLDSTLVILTSTYGSLLGRHGLWDAAQASTPVNMYDEAISTPMIWSWPGHIPAQGVRPEMISTYDFAATICDLLGVDPLGGLSCGRSYLLVATGKPLPKKEPWRGTVFNHLGNTDMARAERYKVVMRNPGPNEFYDLITDPLEKVNQFDNLNYVTARNPLAERLTSWKGKYSRG